MVIKTSFLVPAAAGEFSWLLVDCFRVVALRKTRTADEGALFPRPPHQFFLAAGASMTDFPRISSLLMVSTLALHRLLLPGQPELFYQIQDIVHFLHNP